MLARAACRVAQNWLAVWTANRRASSTWLRRCPRLLRLPRLRVDGASFIERHRQLGGDLRLIEQITFLRYRRIAGPGKTADKRDLRKQLTAYHIDVVAGGELCVYRRNHIEVAGRGEAFRLFQRGGKHRTLSWQC